MVILLSNSNDIIQSDAKTATKEEKNEILLSDLCFSCPYFIGEYIFSRMVFYETSGMMKLLVLRIQENDDILSHVVLTYEINTL